MKPLLENFFNKTTLLDGELYSSIVLKVMAFGSLIKFELLTSSNQFLNISKGSSDKDPSSKVNLS